MKSSLLGLLVVFLAGCAAESFNRGAYEAAYQKDCIDRTGHPACDPEHETYESYKTNREQELGK